MSDLKSPVELDNPEAIEKEIEWTNWYLEQLQIRKITNQNDIDHQNWRLKELNKMARWWHRFLNYCKTGE